VTSTVEAASANQTERKLESEKAQRIVNAMRESVAKRGAAGSTFDQVAQEAGVSRGLLHYYFGSKERLLAEVVRLDANIRIARMQERLADAHSPDTIIQSLQSQLEEFIEEEETAQTLIYEMLSVSRHSEEIREELAELYRRWREALGNVLREKQAEGVITLRADAEAVSGMLLVLADGLELQILSDPGWDRTPVLETAVASARWLLGGDG
jgi:AcrR family transcriptional regulator